MADVMAPPTPDVSNLPAAGGVNPGAPQVAPPNPAQPSSDQQHSWLGRGIRHIASALEGQQVSYQPDPTTGEAKEVVTPRKPGGVFRDIILGAIAGGAAGGVGKGQHPSGAAGFSQGFQGAQKSRQDQQDKEKSDAQGLAQRQKQQADQTAAQTNADMQAQATIAHNTLSDINYGKNIDLHDHASVQRHNVSGDIISSEAKKLGGVAPVIPDANGKDINGQTGNGPELMKMFNSDPTIMQAPEGFHRIPVFHFDTTGMDHEEGKGYSQDGKPVDPNDHVSVSFLDVPNAAWGKNVTLTKGNVNDVAGSQLAQGKDSDSVTTSFGSLFSLKLKNAKDLNAQHADLIAGPKNDDEAEGWAGKIAAINADQYSSPAEKRWAKVKTDILDTRNKAKDDRLAKEAAAKKEGKEDDMPPLTETSAPGFIAKAQAVLGDTRSTPQQKTLAQQQIDYGKQALKNIQAAAVGLSGAKKREELRVEAASNNAGVGDAMNKFGIKPDDTGEQVLSKIPAPYRETIKGITDYTIDPKTFTQRLYGKSGQSLDRAQSLNFAKLVDPTFDESQYNARYKLREEFTRGKTANNLVALNQVVGHFDRLSKTAERLGNTNYPTLNAAMNFISKQTGSSKVTNFTTDANAVAGELATIFKGAGGTDQEIKHWKEQINPDMSKEQFSGFVEEGMGLIASRLAAQSARWEQGMGKTYDFKLVSPHTREILSKLPGGGKVLEAMNISAGGASDSPNSNAGQTPQPKTELPAAAVSSLKEGVHTTFGNGQTWTLQSGQPVQVQGKQ